MISEINKNPTIIITKAKDETISKVKIDMSKIFAPLKVIAYVDIKNVFDPISKLSFFELIEIKQKKYPYILALAQDEGRTNFHYFDAIGLHKCHQKSPYNPVSLEKISNIFYFTIEGLPQNKNDHFKYFGNIQENEHRKNFIDNFLYAHQGNEIAQNNLGVFYKMGFGISKNIEKAFFWLKIAAKAGHPVSQSNLASFYKEDGADQNLYKAHFWEVAAASQGHVSSQWNLGLYYSTGSKDPTRTFYWYNEAAKNGLAKAQCQVGLFYKQGKIVTKDIKKAAYWFTQAAKQNFCLAKYYLGILYLYGKSDVLSQSFETAIFWLKAAAKKYEIPSTYFFLAVCYAAEQNPTKDWEKTAHYISSSPHDFKLSKHDFIKITKRFNIDKIKLFNLFGAKLVLADSLIKTKT